MGLIGFNFREGNNDKFVEFSWPPVMLVFADGTLFLVEKNSLTMANDSRHYAH